MKTWYIVCYRQYDQWSATRPWKSRDEAQVHVDRSFNETVWENEQVVLRKKDYIKNITIVTVELPE